MISKICGDETDNQEEICDNCKASIMSEDSIPPTF